MTENTLRVVSEAVSMVPIQNDNINPEPSEEFVNTPYIHDLTERALAYLEVGYPVHFAGSAGTGKTTLAFHVAAQLGQPVTLIHGDDEFVGSDLIGRDSGYRKSKLVDNYITSVMKTEEHFNTTWEDNRLTTACQNGYTLIYDEFTRSRPEANNALLSILEEKILDLPKLRRKGHGYLEVSPRFRAIFTSNPEEYAGVHKTQDALMDRLITINLGHFDRASEIQVAMTKSGLGIEDAETIVDIVRELRSVGVNNNRPTIRSSIAIARILARFGGCASADNHIFLRICRDVLIGGDTAKVTRSGQSLIPRKVDEIMEKICRNRNKVGKNLQPAEYPQKKGQSE